MGLLTKSEWTSVQNGLFSVPLEKRDGAWKKAVALIGGILEGLNSCYVEVRAEELRYAPECSLCHRAIELDDDFVHKSITSQYSHYDCHYKSDQGL